MSLHQLTKNDYFSSNIEINLFTLRTKYKEFTFADRGKDGIEANQLKIEQEKL